MGVFHKQLIIVLVLTLSSCIKNFDASEFGVLHLQGIVESTQGDEYIEVLMQTIEDSVYIQQKYDPISIVPEYHVHVKHFLSKDSTCNIKTNICTYINFEWIDSDKIKYTYNETVSELEVIKLQKEKNYILKHFKVIEEGYNDRMINYYQRKD